MWELDYSKPAALDNVEDVSKEEIAQFKKKLCEIYDRIKTVYKKYQDSEIRFDFEYNREPEVHKLSEYVRIGNKNEFNPIYIMDKKSLTKNATYAFSLQLSVLWVSDSDLKYGGSANDTICDIFDRIAEEVKEEMQKRSVGYYLDGDTDDVNLIIYISKDLHPKKE